ncbi:MAG: DUF2344 domain-containing protein, partial [Eubacteriaceae bacterium]|nr:DUF2344 domain-containing protein [Eubacteriaceae bacterium]
MKYRICYEKTGRLIYVSHLDMQRLLQRLLRRAGVSMMFSQGFNPHALMSFTPPLPLFASSLAEYVDVELTGKQSASEVRDALSASVPEGISIVSVECPPEGTPPLSKSFFRASYVIELATGASAEEVMSFFDAARELVIERTNKKKQLKTEDIKPRIFSFSAEDTP